jgi:UDP-glucose 4-epimerase
MVIMSDLKKKAVVTGGAGFVGSHIADALAGLGYEVHIIDSLIAGKMENINPKAVFHKLDIADLEKISEAFAGADAVFHLAALPSVPYSIENPVETNKVNLAGTVNVLEAARRAKVRRVIFSSSSAVYGDQEKIPTDEESRANPQSPYGLQKLESEMNCALWSRLYGLETVSLRYFNIYGPRQNPDGAYASVIPKFIRQKKDGEPLTVAGDGKQTRDFINVRDVVRANILAMDSALAGRGEAINIGSGIGCSVNEIAGIIGEPKIRIEPRIEIKDSLASISRAEKLLGWKPEIRIEDGIKEIML